MENWLKQNWFKIGILGVILVVSYLAYSANMKNATFSKYSRCQKIGEDHAQNLTKDAQKSGGLEFVDDYKYTYYKTLDACLFYLSDTSCLPLFSQPCRKHLSIRNLDTNHVVDEVSWRQGEESQFSTETASRHLEFLNLREKVFGE